MTYEYKQMIEDHCIDFESLKGHRIYKLFANICVDEINIVYLNINKQWYAINGLIGSEIMAFMLLDKEIKETYEESSCTCPLPILEQFKGLKIVNIREMGEAWNGHGFELSFENEPNKTLILQSIYTGADPTDFGDCIKIGVGNYVYDIPMPTQQKNKNNT